MYELTERNISKLTPYDKNSRTHTDAQIAEISTSIAEFGFTNPVLIDGQDNIIAGHGRVLAAKFMGLEIIPCIVLEGLTEAQKKAYIIADNKLALNAGWDTALLKDELLSLAELDFDLSTLGFSGNELKEIIDGQIPPEKFREVDINVEIDYTCPKCGYEWSGEKK